MRDSLAALETTGAGLRRPYYLALIVQPDGHAGQIDDARSLLAATLEETQNTGEHWWAAELHRLRGLSRLWLQQGKRDDARACLAPVHHSFTEDFDTADLREARACLAGLGMTG